MSALIQPSPAATAIHSLPTRERRKQPLRACVQSANHPELYDAAHTQQPDPGGGSARYQPQHTAKKTQAVRAALIDSLVATESTEKLNVTARNSHGAGF